MKFLVALLVAVAGSLCLTCPSVEADGCVRSRAVFCPTIRTTTAYVAPTYVAPSVAYNAVQVIEVPTSLDYYYSLQEYHKATLIADAVVGKLTLLNQQQGRAVVAPKGQAANVAPPGPTSMAPAVPGSDEPDAKLAAIVGNSCIRCHSAAKAGGGLDLSNLRAIPELTRYKIFTFVHDGTMPKGGEPLPDDQAKLFQDWARGFKVARQ